MDHKEKHYSTIIYIHLDKYYIGRKREEREEEGKKENEASCMCNVLHMAMLGMGKEQNLQR